MFRIRDLFKKCYLATANKNKKKQTQPQIFLQECVTLIEKNLQNNRYAVFINYYWITGVSYFNVIFKISDAIWFCTFLKNFILFNFTILYWFCHISKWICHRYTCVPHPESSSLLPPHTIPLGHPSAPAPSIQYHASNLDWRLVSYMIFYIFQCEAHQG